MPNRKRRKTKLASSDALDVHEAAWLLGVHIETLRRLARKGGVPAYKLGKDWRFSKKAIERWMETHHARQRSFLVLVVDDEKNIREMVASSLVKDGYRVAVAANGKQAVEAVQREMPDVVLLDLIMPGMNGVEVLKTLHSLKSDLPVIIVTVYPDSSLMGEALRYPPITLLPKPLDNKVLVRTVRQLLHGTKQGD